MARPARNNVDYFPFLCEDGKKMYYIEETYGNDGFSTFIKLLRELAKTDYHFLDLSKTTTLMFLSAKCKISKDLLENIIGDLVELGKFNEALWKENRIVWCQDFIDSIQDAYKKRNNDCITFEGLLILLDGLGIRKLGNHTPKVPVKPQSIVKDSKEEDIKENDVVITSTSTSNIFHIKDFFTRIKIGENQFTLLAVRKTGKTQNDLIRLIEVFVEEQKGLNKLVWQSETDARNHFINWVKKQPVAPKSRFVM